jgi:diguanylate cyclase (GGDEF)-like protein/PAS domain S-box-containing protein
MTPSADNGLPHEEDDLPMAARIDDHPMRLASEITERLSPHEQAAFFATLVDSALDAIIAHRPDGHVIWASQGAVELLGYDSDEIMKMPPYGWVAPTHLSTAPSRIESILREGRLTFESSARRKDGTTIETEVTTRRVDTALGPVVVAVIRDIHDWVESRRVLEHLAYHDPLTGMANRASFDERLAVAIADARRFGDVLGLAYVDLDHFKPVNDRYGHDVGDEVLVEVARRLKGEVRMQDTVARIGGDEFVIVLPRMGAAEELGGVASRVVARVREPVNALGRELNVEASVGLALFDADKDDARSLLVKADTAMYAAKRDPERSWLVYFDGMPAPDWRLDV